jgi:hypothetical protein
MDFIGSAIAQVFEAFVSHGEAVQSIACFLLSFVFAIALIIQSLRSARAHSSDVKETSQALGRISEAIAKLNTNLTTAIRAVEAEVEKHHEIVAETLIRPKQLDRTVDLSLTRPKEKTEQQRFGFDFVPLSPPSSRTQKRRPFRKTISVEEDEEDEEEETDEFL